MDISDKVEEMENRDLAKSKNLIYRKIAEKGLEFYNQWEHEFRELYKNQYELRIMREAYYRAVDKYGAKK